MGRQKSNIKSYIPRQFNYDRKKDPFINMLKRQPKSDLTLEEFMQTTEYKDYQDRSKNQGR